MSGGKVAPDALEVEAFIARWRMSEGAERASFPSFIGEFCELLRMERPQPPTSDVEAVAYRFEYPVKLSGSDGSGTTGRIDLYRKRCFVAEAKQSRQRGQPKEILPAGDPDDDAIGAPRGRRGADRGLDVMMLNAKRQAEQYCRALPAAHGWPPFIILCDVGHCFEFYADFSGQGKNYAQFPDRHRFRVYLEDLRDPAIRAWIARIWSDPTSLDPSRQAALATRQIAQRLAQVSKALERRHDPEDVALFLMRCVFTMFAEDVRLIPADSFKRLLRECLEAPKSFKPLVEDLWRAMDLGRYSSAVRAELKRFNGRMFAEPQVFALGRDGIAELLAAAEHDWSLVDPAIFGTLLEQALEPTERARLGAHYTPRAYVERLVVETVVAPLRDDWRNVLTAAQQARDGGNAKAALALVEDFHGQLSRTRVLDPACGTGNFLHVAQDLMKRLEGEVLEVAAELGAAEQLGGFGARGVGPWQFFGIDANRRAVAIADLMLWIGYLQWHLRTRAFAPSEPILEELIQIVPGDALLLWDDWPVPLVEGGREVTPRNPRRPGWPEVEFIVGNPPFIGGKDLRGRLGDGYVGALRAAYPQMNESADLVMYWWDRAAELLTLQGTRLRRFGFVTTNSITQLFQRRVVERHLNAAKPISLLLAIADHPWTKAGKDTAAVRIAMTVAEAGRKEGRLLEVIAESGLDTDQPCVEVRERHGVINSDLSLGVDVTRTARLLANEGLCSPGVKLHGAGFIVTPAEAEALGLGRRPGLDAYIRRYRNGRDLTARSRNLLAIDLFGLSAAEVRERFPEVYQHVKLRVKEEKDASGQLIGRDANNRASYRELWWLFGEPRKELRPALAGLQRYIATVETAKHRVFQFLDAGILPDNMVVTVALSDAFHLGVLSSRVHLIWSLQQGGTLEDRPRYSKSLCFDPFPFPEIAEAHKQAIREPAEALDALRKDVLARHPDLTLTGLYNVREAILAGRSLSAAEADIRDRGLVLILNEHHEAIDAAVATAYGLPADAEDETILAMLVALNRDRAREEERGTARWLRPDYQRPRFGREAAVGEQIEAAELLALPAPGSARPVFPSQPVERVAAVLAVLATASKPLDAEAIAQRFRQGLKVRSAVRAILISLARVGEVSTGDGGASFARRLRATG